MKYGNVQAISTQKEQVAEWILKRYAMPAGIFLILWRMPSTGMISAAWALISAKRSARLWNRWRKRLGKARTGTRCTSMAGLLTPEKDRPVIAAYIMEKKQAGIQIYIQNQTVSRLRTDISQKPGMIPCRVRS